MIDLKEILSGAPLHIVIKARESFPEYTPGQDIDIVCDNITDMTVYLMDKSDCCTGLAVFPGKNSQHVDYYLNGNLEIRFDLYQQIISPKFTEHLWIYKKSNGVTFVPISYFDDIIKCWEWKHNRKKKYRKYRKYKTYLEFYED